jgi:hypothetical protein
LQQTWAVVLSTSRQSYVGLHCQSKVLDDLDMDIEINSDDLDDGDWLEENSIDSKEILDHHAK